jgi:MATE family multidrug resistance protein
MGQVVIIGAPISLAFLLEYGMFSTAGLLMGLISTVALAAHQIALQVVAILFMIPYGISMAATVRVGHAAGRRDPEGVRRAGYTAIVLALSIAVVLTLAVLALREPIIHLFVGEDVADADAAVTLAATLLAIGATFFVTDALQSVTVGALRGIKDTRVPLAFAVLGYWLIGFPLSYALGIHSSIGARGVWVGLSIGTAIYAALLVLRFRQLTARPA